MAQKVPKNEGDMPDHNQLRIEEKDQPVADSERVLPPGQGYDADWQERIERAKRAREEGKKARANKPSAFTTSHFRI